MWQYGLDGYEQGVWSQQFGNYGDTVTTGTVIIDLQYSGKLASGLVTPLSLNEHSRSGRNYSREMQ